MGRDSSALLMGTWSLPAFWFFRLNIVLRLTAFFSVSTCMTTPLSELRPAGLPSNPTT